MDCPKESLFSVGPAAIQFLPNNERCVAVGEGGIGRILDASSLKVIETFDTEWELVNCVQTSVNDKEFIAVHGSSHVSTFSVGDGQLVKDIVRLPGEVRSINRQGDLLCIGGDDNSVHLVHIDEEDDPVVFPDHIGGCIHVSLDPKQEFVSSVAADGVLRIWKISNNSSPAYSLPLKGASLKADFPILGCSWHPSGSSLAVPFGDRIAIIERSSWERSFELLNDSEIEISSVCWSNCGKFLLAANYGPGFVVNVWNVLSKTIVQTLSFDTAHSCSSMDWSKDSSLLVLTTFGGEVMSHAVDMPAQNLVQEPINEEEKVIDEFEGVPVNLENGAVAMDDVESAEEGLNQHKRSGKRRKLIREANEDSDEEEVFSENNDMFEEDDLTQNFVEDEEDIIQDSFQPGATPESGRLRMLGWNLFGSVESQRFEAHNLINVQFSDVSFHRPVRFNDHFGFQMADVGPRGVVLASVDASEDGGPPSTILFKPFNNWASKSDWRISFTGNEEAVCVAIGKKWLAVATSMRYIRVMSLSRRQLGVISISGKIISMCRHNNHLAVFFQSGRRSTSGPNLAYRVFNVAKTDVEREGFVPLTPLSTLVWVGYSESGILCTTDSKGITRGLFNVWGSSWIPLLDWKSFLESPEDNFWTVGITDDNVMTAMCKASDFPKISPRPILHSLPWKIPLLDNSDETRLESSIMIDELGFSEVMRRQRVSSTELMKKQAQIDKKTTKLIRAALDRGNQFRALDLSTSLHLEQSLGIVQRLVERHKLPLLSQKLKILQKVKSSGEKRKRSSEGEISSNSTTAKPDGTNENREGETKRQRSQKNTIPQPTAMQKEPKAQAVPPKEGSFARKLQDKRQESEGKKDKSIDFLGSL